ncbi:NUDIX domain-containing protein [Lysinibacillus parviboronicapiens]|nr:NUDIX domain-containing protein [Lysinibacillus parviboronicapiens]
MKWLGGNIEKDKTPLVCAFREIREETPIKIASETYRGKVTWTDEATI